MNNRGLSASVVSSYIGSKFVGCMMHGHSDDMCGNYSQVES
jgi:hypothetical protein